MDLTLPLSGNTLEAQRKAELSARVSASLFDWSHRMCRNPRDPFWLGARSPRWRLHHGRRRVCGCGYWFERHGLSAAGFGSVHKFLLPSNAHRSPFVVNASGTAREHYPLRGFPRQFTFSTDCLKVQLPVWRRPARSGNLYVQSVYESG